VRSRALITVFVLAAQPASAETWKNMYLADTGGSRLIGVEPAESEQIDAYIEQSGGDTVIGPGSGLILGISCDRIRLANGDPFMGSEVEAMATFDNSQDVPLGRFGYAGGAYWATYEADLMSAFRSHATVSVTVPSNGLSFVFRLDGFAEAFDRIECFKRKTP
jgi:hypothetical protein